jgi:hypothetical protein
MSIDIRCFPMHWLWAWHDAHNEWEWLHLPPQEAEVWGDARRELVFEASRQHAYRIARARCGKLPYDIPPTKKYV